MMTMLRDLIRQGLEILRIVPRADFACRIATSHPRTDELRPGRMVVVRDPRDKWLCFECPCGCGETTKFPLNQERRPQWRLNVDRLNRPTVSPSIRQTSGCRSHYWIRQGCVDWCRDLGQGRSAGF